MLTLHVYISFSSRHLHSIQAAFLCSQFNTQNNTVSSIFGVNAALFGTNEGLNCLYSVLCAALVFIMHGGFAMVR